MPSCCWRHRRTGAWRAGGLSAPHRHRHRAALAQRDAHRPRRDTARLDTARLDTARLDTARLDTARLDTGPLDAVGIDRGGIGMSARPSYTTATVTSADGPTIG
jgi:hypothetical protein